MKKLGKLGLNFQKILKNEELLILRGGYDDCPCGIGTQNWWAEIWRYGIFYFSGYACGTYEYIKSIYPEGEGYDVRLTGPFQDCQ